LKRATGTTAIANGRLVDGDVVGGLRLLEDRLRFLTVMPGGVMIARKRRRAALSYPASTVAAPALAPDGCLFAVVGTSEAGWAIPGRAGSSAGRSMNRRCG
jgi:hypothetical protein